MSIPEDRLSLESLTQTPVSAFNAETDQGYLLESRSLSNQYTSSQATSILTPTPVTANNNLNSGIGIFSNNCSGAQVPASLRNNYYGSGFNKSSRFGSNNTICPNTKAMFGADNVLGQRNNFDIMESAKSLIPVSKEGMLNSIVGDEIGSVLGRVMSAVIGVPLCLLAAVVSGVLGALGKIGSTLANKLGLKDLFSNKLSACLAKALTGAGVNNTITNITTGSVINNSLALGRNNGASTIDGMLDSGYTTRQNVYSGLGYSLSQDDDKYTEDKLYLANSVYQADENPSLSTAYTRSNTDTILNNLSSSNRTSNIPSEDYENTTGGLDVVAVGWDKDSSGDTNLYRTVGNDRLSNLSAAKVGDNGKADLSGNYDSSFNRAETINILNNVA